MTDYVILKQDESGYWSYLKHVAASSAEEAARKVGEEGTFAPIPTRSWNEFTLEQETKPRLKLTRRGSKVEL